MRLCYLDLDHEVFELHVDQVVDLSSMMMDASITFNSSLILWIQGLCGSNP